MNPGLILRLLSFINVIFSLYYTAVGNIAQGTDHAVWALLCHVWARDTEDNQ